MKDVPCSTIGHSQSLPMSQFPPFLALKTGEILRKNTKRRAEDMALLMIPKLYCHPTAKTIMSCFSSLQMTPIEAYLVVMADMWASG
jgi:hypothetical protein